MVGIRPLTAEDWPTVAEVYAQGIATGVATFETETPTWAVWDAGHLEHPRLVAEAEDVVVGWAALSPVSPRTCYRGVAEVSVYVAEARRGHGVGTRLLSALAEQAAVSGLWTLQATVFADNDPSRALHARCGFRIVGWRERIAELDGVWRDTLLLERRL